MTRLHRNMPRIAALWMVGATAALGQDVIYSEYTSNPGGGPVVRRYEQYGYGQDAVVRYRGSTYGPGPQAVQDEHVRYGNAPVFGAFSTGIVGRQGYDPEGLFNALGRGSAGEGQRRLDTVIPAGPAEVWPTSIFAGPYAPPLTVVQPTVPYSRGYNYRYGPDSDRPTVTTFGDPAELRNLTRPREPGRIVPDDYVAPPHPPLSDNAPPPRPVPANRAARAPVADDPPPPRPVPAAPRQPVPNAGNVPPPPAPGLP